MVFATGFSIHWVRTQMLKAAVGILTLAHLIPHAKLLEATITLNTPWRCWTRQAKEDHQITKNVNPSGQFSASSGLDC